jgi:hypothetical protein
MNSKLKKFIEAKLKKLYSVAYEEELMVSLKEVANYAIDMCLEEIEKEKETATNFSVDIKNNYKVKDWMLEGENIKSNIKKLKI